MPPPNTIQHSVKLEDCLPLELDYIPEDFRKRAKTELFEDEETRINSLRLLRTMLRAEEPDLHWQDEELFLLAFLRARKFDVKRAFHLVKTFYTAIGKRDELYLNYNFEDVRKTCKENSVGFLTHRDSEGCAILIIRIRNWNPHNNTSGDVMRTLSSGLLHANLSPATHIAGFKVIFDFGGFTLRQLPHVAPAHVWLLAEALQNCFPGRFRAVHMVNEGSLFSYFWAALKQLLSRKMRDRFHFHGKNMKTLHKYFSPSILPADFEGELPPFDNTEWSEMLSQHSDYITKVFSHGYQKYKVKAQEKPSSHSNSCYS